MHNTLIQLITKSVKLSDSEEKLCFDYFEPVSFPKNHLLEEEGKIPRYLYFIISGFIRLYHYNTKGDQVTTHINCPPGFITSYTPFSTQVISNENLECITGCQLLRITKENLDLLLPQSPSFQSFSISVFQETLAYNETRAKDLATLTAEERYVNLVEHYPEIIQNVPIQYIASFLGMNPKSLSRIRKQLIK